jgi:hypothetical protein
LKNLRVVYFCVPCYLYRVVTSVSDALLSNPNAKVAAEKLKVGARRVREKALIAHAHAKNVHSRYYSNSSRRGKGKSLKPLALDLTSIALFTYVPQAGAFSVILCVPTKCSLKNFPSIRRSPTARRRTVADATGVDTDVNIISDSMVQPLSFMSRQKVRKASWTGCTFFIYL